MSPRKNGGDGLVTCLAIGAASQIEKFREQLSTIIETEGNGVTDSVREKITKHLSDETCDEEWIRRSKKLLQNVRAQQTKHNG